MATPLKPTVLRVSEDYHLTRTGFTRRVRLEYMVGDDGPFSLTLAEEEFTAGRANELMAKRAAELAQLPR